MPTPSVTPAIRPLRSPSQVSTSAKPGPSSSSSSGAAVSTGTPMSLLFIRAASFVQRMDRGDADAEAREDLREVLQVADQRPAEGLEVELGRDDQRVARLHHLRFEAAAAEPAALLAGLRHGAVGAQDEHVGR